MFPLEQTRGRSPQPAADRDPLPELSPELVLVDPDLADRARLELYEPGCFRPRERLQHVPLRPLVMVAPAAGVEVESKEPSFEAFTQPAKQGITHRRMGPRIVVGGWLLAFAAGLLAAGLGPRLVGWPGSVAATKRAVGPTTAPAESLQNELPAPLTGIPAPTKRTTRTLAWAPATGAGSYETALYRGSIQVFAARTAEPRITISSPWTYRGQLHRLEAGSYRWYVWTVSPDGEKGRQPIVQAMISAGSVG